MDALNRCLDDLEQRIDETDENRLWQEWVAFTEGRFTGDLFCPERRQPNPPNVTWPALSTNAGLRDFDVMALRQFETGSRSLAEGNGALLAVRASYGVAILPSLFGARLFYMDEGAGELPNAYPLEGGLDTIRKLIARGVPDLHQSLAGQTLEMSARFMDIKQRYPKINRQVHVYHPDLQGPMDVCEMLWGSSLFLDIMDHPELVHQFLDLITETYLRFMQEWLKIVPAAGPYAVHWNMLHKGRIMLRDDSAMNFSPNMFAEFIHPYDERLLEALGGGGIHFCGRGDHYIARATESRRLYAIEMSQPEYNDMEIIYRHTVDRGLKLLDLPRAAAEAALAAGRPLRGQAHSWKKPVMMR